MLLYTHILLPEYLVVGWVIYSHFVARVSCSRVGCILTQCYTRVSCSRVGYILTFCCQSILQQGGLACMEQSRQMSLPSSSVWDSSSSPSFRLTRGASASRTYQVLNNVISRCSSMSFGKESNVQQARKPDSLIL